EADSMTGGMVSTTVMTVEQVVEFVELSVAVSSSVFVPKGSAAEKETKAEVGGPPAGMLLVCTGVPFNFQITSMGSPAASETDAVKVPCTLHSTVTLLGQMISGATLANGINWPRISPPGFVSV